MRLALALVAITVAGMPIAEAKPKKAPKVRHKVGTELTPADLEWPATTRSLRATIAARVLRAPGHGDRWGSLATDTRVTWKRILVVRDSCRIWVEIDPHGWVCSTELAPSAEAPQSASRADPAQLVDKVLAKPFIAADRRGARAYKTVDDVRHGEVTKKLKGWYFLRVPTKTVQIGNEPYYKTLWGLVRAKETVPHPASRFEGIDLTAKPMQWPFAWVDTKPDETVAVRSAPNARAPEARRVQRREVVAIAEQKDGFARIGTDEWIDLHALRIARKTARPPKVRADERWLDVDLDQQTLIAYAGDTPVYATLISSGLGKSTPTAIHRIHRKQAITRIQSPAEANGTWDWPDVPFMMTFRKYYAIHTTYWHDNFGGVRSQGCVNMSPRDARWVFDWTYPNVPPGWSEGAAVNDEGTPIRIHDAKHPNPEWMDFDSPPPSSVKLRDVAVAPPAPTSPP